MHLPLSGRNSLFGEEDFHSQHAKRSTSNGVFWDFGCHETLQCVLGRRIPEGLSRHFVEKKKQALYSPNHSTLTITITTISTSA